MATRTARWQRRVIVTSLAAASVITPLVTSVPAYAASLCAPPADTVPPQVSDVTFSTQAVNVTTGPRKVTVTADATDGSGSAAPSGVKHLTVFLSGPDAGASVALSLASGTAADGVWSGAVTIPKTARTGTWRLREVSVRDAKGNEQDYSGGYSKTPQSPSDIALQSGWDRSIAVTGATQPPPPTPRAAGTVTGFSFSPQTVNTTTSPKTIHVHATFSAVRPRFASVFFFVNSGRYRFGEQATLRHSTGDHWHGHLRIPSWVGDIKIRPQLIVGYQRGVKPRSRDLTYLQLRADHFPSVLTVTSGVDRTKPTLASLSFSPSSVNTTTGVQTVAVTAGAKEVPSGVAHVAINLGISHGDADGSPVGGFYPYPGVGFSQTGFVGTTLTHQGSKWVGTLTFRRCEPSGKWHINVDLTSNARRFAYYGTKALAADGLPSTLSVTSTPGDVEPPTVRGATASSSDHTITLDFSEGVKNVTTSTLSVYALRPVADRFQQTSTISSIVCSNGETNVDCSGSGGLVTSATLTVPAVVLGKEFQVYANLGGITSQLTDGAGNPLSWNFQAADVTGS